MECANAVSFSEHSAVEHVIEDRANFGRGDDPPGTARAKTAICKRGLTQSLEK